MLLNVSVVSTDSVSLRHSKAATIRQSANAVNAIEEPTWTLPNCDSPSLMVESRPMLTASPTSPAVTSTGLVKDRPASWTRPASHAAAPGHHRGRVADRVRAGPKPDEREVLVDLFDVEPGLLAGRERVVILVDKGYRDVQTEASLAERGVTLVRPAYRGEAPRPSLGLFRPLRQRIGVGRPDAQGPA